MIFQKSYLMGFKLILVALLDRNSRREILKSTNFALRIIRWGFSVIWNRIYCNDSYKVIDSSSIAPDILIFVFPNYLKTKFPSDPWTNIDPGCGSVPLFKSRNVLSSHKKAIYVTFGAATFSALEEDIEIANCDAAKVDYINFISTLGRFTNWYFMLNRSQQFASFSKKRTIPVM